jgi:lipopolysaccharide/colanic/teichoic acid biosynthesis glycosyltransferase
LMVSRGGPVVRMAVTSSDLLTHGLTLGERAGVPLVTLQRATVRGLDAVLKRALDIVGACMGLVLMGPPLIMMAAASRRGPFRSRFVRHCVYGADGERVDLWLLSPRICGTPLFRGVPTLLRVLTGQLSLVGPRPVSWTSNAPLPPAQWIIGAKPGLTGPWRLTGPDSSIANQAVQDLTYIRTYSIWEDLRLLCESIRRVGFDHKASTLARWEECAMTPSATSYHVPRLIQSVRS